MLLRKEALKKWERAGISEDFIFGKVMRNYPDLCLELLQEILPDLEIESIRYPETQKAVDIDRDADGRYREPPKEEQILSEHDRPYAS